MPDFSRRTVVRGTAWTVPVVAIATSVPAFAASLLPPPPVVNLAGACGNTGANQKGCGIDKTLQVPVTVTNPTSVPIVFQVTSFLVSNTGTAPTVGDGAGTGVYEGVSGIFATNSSFTENVCQAVTTSACPGGANDALPVPQNLVVDSVVVAANTTAYFFVLSQETQSSSEFSATIGTRLLSAACSPIAGTTATLGRDAIPRNNCD